MADSNASYGVSIFVDMPDYPAGVVTWTNKDYFVSGNLEVFPGKQYSLTLDGSGQGTQILPCPDNTGDTAVNWRNNLPSKESVTTAIAYSAGTQNLSDILASASTTTDPDNIIAALTAKVDIAGDTMTGDLAFSNAGITAADSVGFNTSYTPTGSEAEGTAYWDSAEGTLSVMLENGSILNVGQEFHFYGKASGDIANGELVQFAGAQGDHILIKKTVPAEIIANPRLFIGIATQPITNGSFGRVTWLGYINDVYTKTPNNQDSADWSAGDLLYFDNTTGQLTKTAPQAPEVMILIAAVVKAQTGASETGRLVARPTFGTKLIDLDDVDGTPPSANGDLLVWDNDNGVFDFTANISDFDAAGTAAALVDDLSGVTDAVTARANLGLGTMAVEDAVDYYTTSAFSASPTAEEPLKADGSGGLSLVEIRQLSGSAAFPESASGTDRLAIGVKNGTPRILLEDGGVVWQVDNNGGVFRWFTPGVVQMLLTTSSAAINQPLTVTSPLATSKTLVLKLAASPTANALEVQSSASAVQFAIGPTGQIKTNQDAANTNTPSGATAHQLPIYNEAGTLLGYIPVYATAW